jgi:hypothetical protein
MCCDGKQSQSSFGSRLFSNGNSASINNDVFTKSGQPEYLLYVRYSSYYTSVNLFESKWLNSFERFVLNFFVLYIECLIFLFSLSNLEAERSTWLGYKISRWSCLDLTKMEGKAKEKWTEHTQIYREKSKIYTNIRVRERESLKKKKEVGC